MKSYLLVMLTTLSLGFTLGKASSQTATENEPHSEMNHRGDHVMGFSQEKATHHFELTYDGGLIDVRANDASDTTTRNEIRGHFHHIARMFAEGNFNAPMLVHGKDVPGTATMTQSKDRLHWELQETPRGARLNISADTKPALDAVHEFLKFQIEDHKTGDCTAVR